MLDDIDQQIIVELQKDADRKVYQLERVLKVPRSTIHNRIQKLKKSGIITKIKAVANAKALGLNVCAMIHVVVSFKKGVHLIAEKLSKMPNVEEVYITAGEYDLIAKVRFKDNEALSNFIFNDKNGLKVMEGVERTESMICLETIKENGLLE